MTHMQSSSASQHTLSTAPTCPANTCTLCRNTTSEQDISRQSKTVGPTFAASRGNTARQIHPLQQCRTCSQQACLVNKFPAFLDNWPEQTFRTHHRAVFAGTVASVRPVLLRHCDSENAPVAPPFCRRRNRSPFMVENAWTSPARTLTPNPKRKAPHRHCRRDRSSSWQV